MQNLRKINVKQNLKRFFSLITNIHPKYWQMVCGLLIGAVAIGLQLAVPAFAREIINDIRHLDKGLIALVILLFALSTLLGALSGSFLGFFGEDVVYKLREQLWNKILTLPVSYFDETHSGEIASRLTNDTTQVKELLANSLPRMATSLLQLIGAMVLMMIMDFKMTIIMFIVVPLILLCLLPVFRQSYRISHQRQDALAQLNGRVSEVLGEIRLVKSSNGEPQEKRSGKKQMYHLYQIGLREAIYDSIVGPVTGVIMLAMIVGILAYGALRISAGTMDTGTLTAFLMYLIQMIVPFTTLGQFFSDVSKAGGSTSKIQQLLQAPQEITKSGHNIEPDNKVLKIENVSFSYESGNEILHNISFTAKPNSVIAFVGPSGSGKSTIFSLIERFYRPDSGKVLIGNKNLADVNLAKWRSEIGLVGQNSDTLAGTIRYNLTYGLKRKVSENELWHALEMAYAKDFVTAMPDELDTQIGEHGVKISGGQRQRISIARAFLRNPKILMLDEATAALDPESEMMVQKALAKLMIGRTTLVIAHRVNTIIDADEIFFIDNGKVTAHGSHQQLIKSFPMYRQYFQDQTKDDFQITKNN